MVQPPYENIVERRPWSRNINTSAGQYGVDDEDDGCGTKCAKARKSCCKFLYNSEKGTFCGRKCSSWGKILLFYLLFYIALMVFVCMMFFAFLHEVHIKRPNYYGNESGILLQPGLSIIPRLDQTDAKQPLISFKKGDDSTYKEYVKQLTEFLDKHVPPNTVLRKVKNCTDPDPAGCDVKRSILSECNGVSEKQFGFDMGKPCILIKLNKVMAWIPDEYKKPFFETQSEFEKRKKEASDQLGTRFSNRKIGIQCFDEKAKSQSEAGFDVDYFPSDGIPFGCFPFCDKEEKNFTIFPVMARFKPKKKDVIFVGCRAYAGNIKYHKRDRAGSYRFRLEVQDL